MHFKKQSMPIEKLTFDELLKQLQIRKLVASDTMSMDIGLTISISVGIHIDPCEELSDKWLSEAIHQHIDYRFQWRDLSNIVDPSGYDLLEVNDTDVSLPEATSQE